MTARRQFIQWIPAAGLALMATRNAQAQAKLSEKDPQAVSLGYVEDAKKADKAKFPKYADGQHCASCQLFGGKAGDAAGSCALFAGKQVNANGWCSAWTKKAA